MKTGVPLSALSLVLGVPQPVAVGGVPRSRGCEGGAGPLGALGLCGRAGPGGEMLCGLWIR